MLKELAPKAARSALRRAAKKGAAIWQEAIEEKAPRHSGFLAENIKVASQTGDARDNSEEATASVTVEVGPGRQAWYGMFQEFGTKYQKAQPFVRPSFEENKDEVLDTFAAELKSELEKLSKN